MEIFALGFEDVEADSRSLTVPPSLNSR